MIINFTEPYLNNSPIDSVNLLEVDFNDYEVSFEIDTYAIDDDDFIVDESRKLFTFRLLDGVIRLKEIYQCNDHCTDRFEKMDFRGLSFGKARGVFSEVVKDCKTIVLQNWTTVNGYTIDDFDIDDWGD